MKRNYLARELRLNAKSQIPGFRNSAFWNFSPPSAPLERVVTNEYFRVYGLAGKKTVHRTLFTLAEDYCQQNNCNGNPFPNLFLPACACLPVGRVGRRAPGRCVAIALNKTRLLSPDRVRGRNDNFLNRDLGRRAEEIC
jgi:hypothetical protein